MRRKNRQLKLAIDIPDGYDDEEDFMNDLRDTLDENEAWQMAVEDQDGKTDIPIRRITLGDLEIMPEDEEE